MDIKDYISIEEARELLQVSRVRIWQLLQTTWKHKGVKIGKKQTGAWLIPRSLVESYTPRKKTNKLETEQLEINKLNTNKLDSEQLTTKQPITLQSNTIQLDNLQTGNKQPESEQLEIIQPENNHKESSASISSHSITVPIKVAPLKKKEEVDSRTQLMREFLAKHDKKTKKEEW